MRNTIYVNGRYDGIGNRLEELLRIEHHCISNNLMCFYYWDNSGNDDRRYPILFKSVNIRIQDKVKYPINMIGDIGWMTSREQMIVAAKNVRLIKPLELVNHAYIGVHIRTGDRIRHPVPHNDFMDVRMFREIFEFTIKQINLEKPEYIFICSDAKDYRDEMISRLDSDINVIDPLVTKYPLQVYNDFYALSNATKIYMCSKFSSFAITASILTNIPIVSFFEEGESNLIRYHANVIIVRLPQKFGSVMYAQIMRWLLSFKIFSHRVYTLLHRI